MEGPLLPGGSGGKEPPEEPQEENKRSVDKQAELWYTGSMARFAQALDGPKRRARKERLSDYTTKNCEEAWGYRNG